MIFCMWVGTVSSKYYIDCDDNSLIIIVSIIIRQKTHNRIGHCCNMIMENTIIELSRPTNEI